MSFTLAPIVVGANTSEPITLPGDIGTVSWIKIVNASPYLLLLTNLNNGQDYMQPGEANVWHVPGLTTSVQLTALPFVSNANLAPTSVVVVTWYLENEQPQGTYPVNFNALYFGGTSGVPSNSIEQDMWTPFVLSGLVPSHSGNNYQATAGVAFLRQSDNSLLRTSVSPFAQTLSGISQTYYHDLNPDGSFSLATTHSPQANYLTIATITTNGSGNITTVTDTRVLSSLLWNAMQNSAGAPGVSLYNLHVFKDIQADDAIAVQGTLRVTNGTNGGGYNVTTPANSNLNFQPYNETNDASVITFYVNPTGTPPLTAIPVLCLGYAASVGAVQIDTGGVIHANAPLTLAGGYQETGVAGYTGYAPGAGNGLNFIFNFKTVMTNTPTSLTSSNLSTPTNANSLGFNLITKYGANMFWSATAAGISTWAVQYATVGNCLLAVDTIAGTFDHHCEGCGGIHRGVALATLASSQGATPAQSALCFTCPACGMMEHFNCALTDADTSDPTPQGSGPYATTRGAQATLIRALTGALGLAVAV